MTALAIIVGALLAWLVREFLTAPIGWQDATGFHRGPEPFDPPAYSPRAGTDPAAEPFGSATAHGGGAFSSKGAA